MLHQTTRPSLLTSHWDDLDAAVRAVAGERGTGALVVTGDHASGTLFFEDGQITFALSTAEDVTELLDPTWFETLGGGPSAVEASLGSSGSPAETAGRVEEIIDRVVRGLRANESATMEFGSAAAPVRTLVAFDAGDWFDLSAPATFGIFPLTRIA